MHKMAIASPAFTAIMGVESSCNFLEIKKIYINKKKSLGIIRGFTAPKKGPNDFS